MNVAREISMDELKQQQLRQLAQQQMRMSTDPHQHALAQGTLDLLKYVDELVVELEVATEKCCEAMCVVYDYTV
jgi:hypothetical protein